jgi:hypothetical protein
MTPEFVSRNGHSNDWKRLLSLLIFFCLTFAAPWGYAQTCSIPGNAGTLSSAVSELNSYWPGTGSPVAGATGIAVAAGAGFAPIAAGDLLLIIQMQAADLNTTDTNSYGDGTASPGVTSTVAFGVAGYAVEPSVLPIYLRALMNGLWRPMPSRWQAQQPSI